MEKYRSVCLCLWLLGLGSLLVIGATGQTDVDYIFTEQPRSTSVLLGDSVTLRCRVNTSTPLINVYWRDSEGNTIDSDGGHKQNFVLKSDMGGQYDLEIIGVSEDDDQSYFCVVETVESGLGPHLSRIAYLNVRNEVTENRLICFISINELLTEHDNVILNCVLRTNDTNVFLLWEKDGKTTSLGHTERRNNALTVRRFELELTPDDDNSEYRCLAMMGTDTITNSCSLNPLRVRYAPKVTVTPSSWQYYGYQTSYTCEATGNPNPVQYVWYVSNVRLPMADLERYELSNNARQMTIAKAEERDNDVVLRCEVYNDIGLGKGFHTIKLDQIMSLIGPIVVGVILFTAIVVAIAFLIWWHKAPRHRASDTSPRHAITTVWAANGSAIQPHKGFDQRHDGRGKIDGRPKYRKGRYSTTASRASTQLDEEELVSPEMLELTTPASPEDNIAYVYDGSLPGSRPATPKLWNIPRDGRAPSDDIDSGQASRDNDDSSSQSENHDVCSLTDVGDGTPNPPRLQPTLQVDPNDSIVETQVESTPPSPPPPPPPPPPSLPASSDSSAQEDDPQSFDVSEGSVSTFQVTDSPTTSDNQSGQAKSEKDLVYADLAFNPTSDRPPAPKPAPQDDDETTYASIDFNRTRVVDASTEEPHQTHTHDMTTEL